MLQSFRQGKATLELLIEPPFIEAGEELAFVVVSEDGVKAFREWIDKKKGIQQYPIPRI